MAGWPRSFDARRARPLGFTAAYDAEEIISIHIDDEVDGTIPRADA